MDIAISLNLFVDRGDPLELIPRVAAAGFEGDFPFFDLLSTIDWSDERAAHRLVDAWGEAGQRAGLRWVQSHGPIFNMFCRTAADAQAKAMCAVGLRASGKLGVRWMVLHPDVFAGPPDAGHRRAVLQANAAFFRELLPVCEENGTGIAIENLFDAIGQEDQRGCDWYFGARAEELCELIDAVNHPLVGACWDTGHARIMKADQRSSLAMLGPRLKALHIQDNDGGGDDHLLPFAVGRAGVDWNAVIAGLRDAKYPGPFTYEVHKAFAAIPEALYDETLAYAAKIGRHLADAASQTVSDT
ncbi:MAG TPA: sugar phosphate isomerase/epimerase [Tepidisphaeraceae bacterium]|jgi:sugar phosphate isomerase/epimerase|nr:sugar phosphate isomerase/epimerase [Tepidisphaeraceae bacterium]